MWSNCFLFILVISRQPVFQSCSYGFYLGRHLPHPTVILLAASGDVSKPQNCLLTIIWFFFYLSIFIVDQNMSFHGQVGRAIGKITIQLSGYILLSSQCVSHSYHIIQMMYAKFGDFHMFTNTAFLTESHNHSSVNVSLVWLWLGLAVRHVHLQSFS